MLLPQKIERQGFGYNEMEKLDIDIKEIKEFEENHRKHKAVVKEVLEGWDPATNNDFFLYIEVLRVLGLMEETSGKDNFILKIKRENIHFIPSPESITRARRSLNSKGIGLPTNPKVFEKRMRRQKALRQYFKENN